jgi:hypothetical protein
VVFQNISTAAKEYLMSIGDGGIGCVAVHPTRYDPFDNSCMRVSPFSHANFDDLQENLRGGWQGVPTKYLHLLLSRQEGELPAPARPTAPPVQHFLTLSPPFLDHCSF